MDNIRDKIAKLLALAQSPEPEEAKAALLMARELMAKHKLRPEECQKAENAKVVKACVDVECTKMTDTWAVQLSAIIAEHYCCTAYRWKFSGAKKVTIGFIGLEGDSRFASAYIFTPTIA